MLSPVYFPSYVHTWYPVQHTSNWQSIIPRQLRWFILTPPCDKLWYDTTRQVLMGWLISLAVGINIASASAGGWKNTPVRTLRLILPPYLYLCIEKHKRYQTWNMTTPVYSIIARDGLSYHNRPWSYYMIPGVYTVCSTQNITQDIYHDPIIIS